ncbi:MAG: nucleotidyltransferase domain-containing protein [Candidatus Kapabacteria bacterium]|jgi:predicted nucleotidyltransferase|nr:nucleotidyltransferase domain-containing protein [Candidatus Kapabacteria bacterium]
MNKTEVIELLKTYLLLLKAEGISIDKAFLYGSYLTGTATIDSDIDLMLVSENAHDDYTTGKIWNLTRKVNTKIEPFLVGTKYFYSNDNSPLVDMIKRTGLEIA